MFADDTYLCAQDQDLDCLEKFVNTELDKVNKWLNANKLTLNVDKTKFMLSLKNKALKPKFNIKFNGENLAQCEAYKYLGVFIDKDLTWKPHIEYICKKISKGCGSLAKIRHSAHIDTLISVYYALVYSYIRYGITSWGNASSTTLQPLVSLTTRAVRIMTFAPYGNIDVDSIYKYLDILQIPQVIKLETGKFLFKSHNDLLPTENIANHFEVRNSNVLGLRDRETINHKIINLNTINHKSSHGEKSLQYRGTKVWSDIPEDIRNSNSLKVFNKHYKAHLIADEPIEDDDIYLYYKCTY